MRLAKKLLATPEGAIGLALLLLLALIALLAPVFSPGDPLRIAGRALVAPFTDPALPLGTDRLGRDVFAGLLHVRAPRLPSDWRPPSQPLRWD